jgi:hypothetical protein
MFIAEHFLPDVVEEYIVHPFSTDGGAWYPTQACQFLKLEYRIHLHLRKALLKEMQYIKARTEGFDD